MPLPGARRTLGFSCKGPTFTSASRAAQPTREYAPAPSAPGQLQALVRAPLRSPRPSAVPKTAKAAVAGRLAGLDSIAPRAPSGVGRTLCKGMAPFRRVGIDPGWTCARGVRPPGPSGEAGGGVLLRRVGSAFLVRPASDECLGDQVRRFCEELERGGREEWQVRQADQALRMYRRTCIRPFRRCPSPTVALGRSRFARSSGSRPSRRLPQQVAFASGAPAVATGPQAGALVVDSSPPAACTTAPSTRSMRSACGEAGRPGILMMSPSRGTT